MRAAILFLTRRLSAAKLTARQIVARYGYLRLALVAIPHVAAIGLMFATEFTVLTMAVYLLAWGILNFVWLVLIRRPAVAAMLSLAMMTVFESSGETQAWW